MHGTEQDPHLLQIHIKICSNRKASMSCFNMNHIQALCRPTKYTPNSKECRYELRDTKYYIYNNQLHM